MSKKPSYFENLEQYIFDNNQIVTFGWLSNELSVPCPISQQMLYAFSKHNTKALATYAVSGRNGDRFTITVVPQKKLDETLKFFDEVLDVHVFSLEKDIPKDSALLALPENQIRKDLINNNNSATDPFMDDRYTQISFSGGKVLKQAGAPQQRKSSVSESKFASTTTAASASTMAAAAAATTTKPVAAAAESANADEAQKAKEKEAEKKQAAPRKGSMMSFFTKDTTAVAPATKKNEVDESKVETKGKEKQSEKASKESETKSKSFFGKTASAKAAVAPVATLQVKIEPKAAPPLDSDEDEPMIVRTPSSGNGPSTAKKRHVIAEDDEEAEASTPASVPTKASSVPLTPTPPTSKPAATHKGVKVEMTKQTSKKAAADLPGSKKTKKALPADLATFFNDSDSSEHSSNSEKSASSSTTSSGDSEAERHAKRLRKQKKLEEHAQKKKKNGSNSNKTEGDKGAAVKPPQKKKPAAAQARMNKKSDEEKEKEKSADEDQEEVSTATMSKRKSSAPVVADSPLKAKGTPKRRLTEGMVKIEKFTEAMPSQASGGGQSSTPSSGSASYKRQKLVQRETKNSKGYTVVEEVLVDVPDDEVDAALPPAPAVEAKPIVRVATAPKSEKQAQIMSFFKKK